MNSEMTIVERRHRPRTGILAEIENITYAALRKYGIEGSMAQQNSESTPEKSA